MAAERPLDLEGRIERIETIARSLETDEVELERALELFEEAIGLVREIQQALDTAELRVEELLGGTQDPELRPLGEDADASSDDR